MVFVFNGYNVLSRIILFKTGLNNGRNAFFRFQLLHLNLVVVRRIGMIDG